MKTLILSVLLLSIGSMVLAQSDKPLTLSSANAQVVKSDIRHMKEGNPSSLITTPVNQLGEHIAGLTKKDFRINKGKKEAMILNVEELKAVESTVMRVIFMVDNSQSMSPYLNVLRATLENILRKFSKAVRVSVLFFNEHDIDKSAVFHHHGEPLPIVRMNYTNDKERVITYTNKMLVEPNLSRSTYLYDGVYSVFQQITMDTGKVDRSFAIVFSDGEDNASKVDAATSLYEDKLNTTFYTIDYRTKSNKFLEQLALDTKGKHFIAKDASELVKAFDEIATKIVAKGYEITYQFKAPPIASITTPTKELVMQEEIVRETFPLLNYIFFAQGSSIIPERYRRITGEAIAKFDESTIEGGALDFYYTMLNVIGSRLLKFPEAKITITGCIDNFKEEKNNTKLALERANAVKSYLNIVWGIADDRMTIIAAKLPAIASSSRDSLGREENRRVEIVSDNWQVMKPVTFIRRIATVHPEKVIFATTQEIPEGLESFIINVEQNGNVFDSRSGSVLEKAISWNWKNKKNELPSVQGALRYNLSVTDKAGDAFTSTKESISVREEKIESRKNVSLDQGITKEKISLILFEFDKFEMGPRNAQIMDEFVYPRIEEDLRAVTISGFTDIIGLDSYNQTLSDKRAKAVYDVFMLKQSATVDSSKVRSIGYGETNPNFDNKLPEGRFYNRTVNLLLEK